MPFVFDGPPPAIILPAKEIIRPGDPRFTLPDEAGGVVGVVGKKKSAVVEDTVDFDTTPSGPHFNFTNSDKTAERDTALGAGYNTAYVNVSKTTSGGGKWYIEFLVNTTAASTLFFVSNANTNGSTFAYDNSVGIIRDWWNASAPAAASPFTNDATTNFNFSNNDVFQIWVDCVAQKGWFGVNDTADGDPAAGTGNSFSWTGTPTLYTGFSGTTDTATATVRGVLAEQTYAARSGFSTWGTPQ